MKIKLLIGILVFLIVINLAAIGSFLYFRPDHGPRHGPPGMMDLTKEQHQKLRGMMESFHDATRDQRRQIRALEEEILDLLQQDPVSKAAIDEKMQEISAIRLQMGEMAIEQFVEMKSFLSPEQQRHFFRQLMHTRPPPPRGKDRGRRPPPPRRNGDF